MSEQDEPPTLSDELFGREATPAGPAAARPAAPPLWPPFLGEPPGWPDRIAGGTGFVVYALINVVVMWVPLHDNDAGALPQALVLLLLAFGLGSLLAWHVRGFWRPFAFGMMGGWVTLTVLSLGYATGLT